jgi:ABC-type uncharacterized transport system permease subunit
VGWVWAIFLVQEFFFLHHSFARYFFKDDLKNFSLKVRQRGGKHKFFDRVVKHHFNVLKF